LGSNQRRLSRRFYRPPQLRWVDGLWPAVTLAGSIYGDLASHVCPTPRGLGSEVGLSAWELCGAARLPPASWLTCRSAETLSVRNHDCSCWLLRSARNGHARLPDHARRLARHSRQSYSGMPQPCRAYPGHEPVEPNPPGHGWQYMRVGVCTRLFSRAPKGSRQSYQL